MSENTKKIKECCEKCIWREDGTYGHGFRCQDKNCECHKPQEVKECEHYGECYKKTASGSSMPFGYCNKYPSPDKIVEGANFVQTCDCPNKHCPLHGEPVESVTTYASSMEVEQEEWEKEFDAEFPILERNFPPIPYENVRQDEKVRVIAFIKSLLSTARKEALETRNKELVEEIKGMKLSITPEMMGKKEYEAYNEALKDIITLIQSK